MSNTLIKSGLFPNKNKNKLEPELNISKIGLPPDLQSFKQKLLSGSGLLKYK